MDGLLFDSEALYQEAILRTSEVSAQPHRYPRAMEDDGRTA